MEQYYPLNHDIPWLFDKGCPRFEQELAVKSEKKVATGYKYKSEVFDV